jgi:retron-type reverse transcriptase
LRDGMRHGRATKWLIAGDLRACFDRIAPSVLLNMRRERFHDKRFLRLIGELRQAGYLEQWPFHATDSGVPPGGVVSPILSKSGLERLDTYVETPLIPADTHGPRRRTQPPDVALPKQAFTARQHGHWQRARRRRQQAQRLPSRDPNAPHCRRLGSGRYADDMLLGLTGTKREAAAIKPALATCLRHARHLALTDEKPRVTHARDDHATCLGYAGHVLHANSKPDHRRHRGMHGSIGLRVPPPGLQAKRAQ